MPLDETVRTRELIEAGNQFGCVLLKMGYFFCKEVVMFQWVSITITTSLIWNLASRFYYFFYISTPSNPSVVLIIISKESIPK